MAWKAANPGAVGPFAKKLIWGAMRASSPIRVLPDFLIIGAQKCGTTSLYFQLAKHPQVVASLKKETSYFGENPSRSVGWYRAHFPTVWTCNRTRKQSGKVKVFEASTTYCFHPQAPSAAFKTVPTAKLVMLVRDPVSRAISHYHHNVAKDLEKLTMQEAFDIAFERFDSDLANWKSACNGGVQYVEPQRSYLLRGMYDLQITNWLNHYPTEQLIVASAEDLWTQPAETLATLLTFLQLDAWSPETFEAANQRTYDPADQSIVQRLREFYSASNYLSKPGVRSNLEPETSRVEVQASKP